MMRPHSVQIIFATGTMTDQQAQQMLLIGRSFRRIGTGRFLWLADCDAHTVMHALEWAEQRIRSVVGDGARLEIERANIFQI